MNPNLTYYNEIFGDSSFLLAGLLASLLKHTGDWESERWIDDSLFMKVELNQNRLLIWGVIIWGVEGTTDQWTDPFYFEIELGENKHCFNEYTFYFSDLEKPEISYEEFCAHGDYWKPFDEINWKYVLNKRSGTRC